MSTKSQTIRSSDIPAWKGILSGSMAGCLSVLVCHPLDVIRTRLQTKSIDLNNKPVRENSVASNNNFLSNPYSSGRWRAGSILQMPAIIFSKYYRGIIPPLCAQGVYKAVIFGANNFSNKYLNGGNSQGAMKNLNLFSSGCIAGVLVSFVVAPVEIIRTKQIMISDTSSQYRSIATVVKSITSATKPWLLWKYLLPTILRDGPGVGFYFLVFESSKEFIARNLHVDKKTNDISIFSRILAASCAGVSFWLWALPFDTVKTIMEADNNPETLSKSSSKLLKENMQLVWNNGGIKRLYNAWPVAVGRGIPSAIVTLTSYDLMYKYLLHV